jgi:uncharacterized protein
VAVQTPTAFFRACSTGDADAVLHHLRSGVAVEARDKWELTGLIWAGRKGQIEVGKILVDAGASLESGDTRDRTSLFHAVTYKRYEFVEFLAAQGANLNPVDTHGWTPLDFSVVSHHSKMVTLLTALGAVSGCDGSIDIGARSP